MRALKCFLTLILSVAVLTMLPAPSAMAARERHQSVGLVLSGGGAKGIAHIGVIKALEENNIPIDYITGTSMGAIVGGLYACGYTTGEMMEMLLSKDFAYWSTGQIDPSMTFFFIKPEASPQMFSKMISKKDSLEKAQTPPASLIPASPMAFAFMELFSAYSAQCGGDFNRLFVPYRNVTSNMTDRCKMVNRSGNLGDAIRSSMSFPLVFQPITIDGKLCYDGGIYDNFPVDVMREDFAPSIMIGIDVSTPSSGPPTSFMDQLDLLVVQSANYDLPAEEGIKLHVDLSRFGLLDFQKAREISDIGYRHAMDMMDSIKSRIHVRANPEARRVAREVFKSRTPYLRFDSVDVTGGTPRQNEYLSYLYKPHEGSDTIGVTEARKAYYKALSSGRIASCSVKATPDDSTGLFRLAINTSINDGFDVGAGGYITSSNNSYLYVRGGFSSLRFSTVNANIQAWIGQSYMAGMFDGKIYLHSGVPSAFAFEAVASRRKYYENDNLFFKFNEPVFVVNHEFYGKLKWATAAGSTGKIDLGVGVGHLSDSYYSHTSISGSEEDKGRDRVWFTLGQVSANYLSSTLNDINYPTEGYIRRASAYAVTGKAGIKHHAADDTSRKQSWLSLDLSTRQYFNLGTHWALGVEGRALLSTRGLLSDYYASITSAASYSPTPASDNVFNPDFRANSFIAAGVTPVFKFNDSFSIRLTGHVFAPLRAIRENASTGLAEHGRWFGKLAGFGEIDAVYRLPFASVAAYCNYTRHAGFNAGVTLGIYMHAPGFLR